jgi:hypothetical protein
MSTTETRAPTRREQAKVILREAGEDGISKSEMRKKLGGNAGAFRRLMQSMEDKEEMTVTEEVWPTCGPTKVLRHPE